MKVLTPFLSAVVSKKEFDEGVGQEYTKLYVVDEHFNYYLRTKLAAGGECIQAVAELPKPKKPEPGQLEEKVNFLPGGKVPQKFLNQIASFFRSVMDINFGGSKGGVGDQSEAMAHILWDMKEKAYEIGVPKQKVSKGSVEYSFDYLSKDKIIIVDIHSHNTMSSYFSGTDDNDDRKGCWYSGVLGNLHKDVPTASWRFTNFGMFRPLQIDEIFEMEGDINSKTEFPMEWLKRVEGRYIRPATAQGTVQQTTLPFAGQNNWWNSRNQRPAVGGNVRQDRSYGGDDQLDAYDLYLMERYGSTIFNDDIYDDDYPPVGRPVRNITSNRGPATGAENRYRPFEVGMIGHPTLRQEVEDILLHMRTALGWNKDYGVALYRPIVSGIRNIILKHLDPLKPQATGIFMLCRDLIGNLEEDGVEEIFDNVIPDELSSQISSVLAQASDWDGLDAMINHALEEIYYKFVEGSELSMLIDKMSQAFEDYTNKDEDVVKKCSDELASVLTGIVSHKKHYGLYIATEVLRHASKAGYSAGELCHRDVQALAWAVADILQTEADAGNVNVTKDILDGLEKI